MPLAAKLKAPTAAPGLFSITVITKRTITTIQNMMNSNDTYTVSPYPIGGGDGALANFSIASASCVAAPDSEFVISSSLPPK